jgi:hypothetical protein
MLVECAPEVLELLDPRVDVVDPARQKLANLSARWRVVSPLLAR